MNVCFCCMCTVVYMYRVLYYCPLVLPVAGYPKHFCHYWYMRDRLVHGCGVASCCTLIAAGSLSPWPEHVDFYSWLFKRMGVMHIRGFRWLGPKLSRRVSCPYFVVTCGTGKGGGRRKFPRVFLALKRFSLFFLLWSVWRTRLFSVQN